MTATAIKPMGTVTLNDQLESGLVEMQILVTCSRETAERLVLETVLNFTKENVSYVNNDFYHETLDR